MRVPAVLASLVALAAVACSDAAAVCGDGGCAIDSRFDGPPDAPPDPTQCSPWFIGDPGQPIEVAPLAGLGPDPGGTELVEGADVLMMVPPQGGIILLVGVRARNVSGCASQVTAALREPGTGRVVGLESRPASLYARADGWAAPTDPLFASMPNLAVCPNLTSDRDLYDLPWQLELTIEDGARRAMVTRTIVPRCPGATPFADCTCLCDADYVAGTCPGVPRDGGEPGRTGPVDAGPDDGVRRAPN